MITSRYGGSRAAAAVRVAGAITALICVVGLGANTPTAAARPSSAAEVHRGLVYTAADRSPLELDLYLPAGSAPRPLVIYLHGGGFVIGDRTNGGMPLPWGTIDGTARELTDRGYAVATVDYALAPEHPWPAPLFTVKAAVRWLRANADRYRIDPNRFAAWGDSAGGYFASMLGTTGGVAELEGEDGNPAMSSRVQAVADWFGPSDISTMQAQTTLGLPHDAGSPEQQYLGCAPSTCPERARAASPIAYIDRDDPPFLIQHGALDHIVPFGQSVELRDALNRAGVPTEFHGYGDTDHEFLGLADPRAIKKAFFDFLDRSLGHR
ncbi:alpha/beta hydrolase fold domain-containing protein [Nocardia sp. NPDC051570]|uniref:alpha/beta hydrolase fold domain-containing protein n=1 Tax=Nocardia sp. NPDC051570 TaxID=3364324 RepID=UPI0037B2C493